MPTIIQSQQECWTFADLVTYLLDAHGLEERGGLNERHARAAVRYAYRNIAARHAWNYYSRQRLLQTVAEYTTGTVAYDHTGGTYERELTLTTGTWPSWAGYGRVIIDSVHYEVEDRKSNSVVTLTETSNPGADVASTSYTLYRNSYPLPANFGSMTAIWDVDAQRAINFTDGRTHHAALNLYYNDPSTPYHATIRATGKYLSGVEIFFGPPPAEAVTYDLLYTAHPRALSIDEYSDGTVSVSASSATVTGSSTTFPTTCAGSIIRFSSGPVKPSGYNGSVDGADNPFVMQGVIKSRDSATQLTLEEAATVTISAGSGYTISDPLDIDTNRMLIALQAMAEAEFARLSGRQDQDTRAANARRRLLEAMESDTLVENTRGYPIHSKYGSVPVINDS